MDSLKIINRLSKASKTPKKVIAEKLGMTPQGLDHALKNNITFEQMVRAMEACGYAIAIGKLEGGKLVNTKRAEYYSDD